MVGQLAGGLAGGGLLFGFGSGFLLETPTSNRFKNECLRTPLASDVNEDKKALTWELSRKVIQHVKQKRFCAGS